MSFGLTESCDAIGALNPAQSIPPNESSRGMKRSRSPSTYSEIPQADTHTDDGMLSLFHIHTSAFALFTFVTICYMRTYSLPFQEIFLIPMSYFR